MRRLHQEGVDEKIFYITYEDKNTNARVGFLKTTHSKVETPVFMPVGTNANVKCTNVRDLEEIGYSIVLVNTLHMYLRPGHSIVRKLGGLHKFMGWESSILTDSGGFQVFSLRNMSDLSDEGVWFKSPIDGSKHFFTPEFSIEVQETLGSDIAMTFDECTPIDADEKYAKESMERTYRWAIRCLKAHKKKDQLLFGIAQGGMYENLRMKNARDIVSLDFDGYAIGGLSIGEEHDITLRMLEATISEFPKDSPRYFMGVGTPDLILDSVERGVDMFDSVFPTRVARHGVAITDEGKINIRSAKFREDPNPIDQNCSCYVCQKHSKAYINHLFSRKEVLGQMLLTYHNLHYMYNFMKRLREAIKSGKFYEFKESYMFIFKNKEKMKKVIE